MSIDLRGINISGAQRHSVHMTCDYCNQEFWHSDTHMRTPLPVFISETMEHRQTCTEPNLETKERCNDCKAELWYTPCTHKETT